MSSPQDPRQDCLTGQTLPVLPPVGSLFCDRERWRTAAVMQPYFFPYGGYFSLIQAVDVFILDDLAQYTPKRWMNRNRLRRPALQQDGVEWQYLTLPVQRCPAGTPIGAVRLSTQPWQQLLWGKLSAYARAPYYHAVVRLLQRWLAAMERSAVDTLADANALGLQAVCDVLELSTPLVRLSTLLPYLPEYRPPYPKGENALAICRALGGVTEYRNLPGGAAFYPRQPYREAGVRLVFQQWTDIPQEDAAPLSVLDLLMDHSPEQIRQSLQQIWLFE